MILHYLKVEQPSSFSEDIEAHTMQLGYNYEAGIEPIAFKFDAVPLENGCALSCSFDYKAVLPCARCLESVHVSGSTVFSIELRPRSAMKMPDKEVEIGEEDTDEIFLDEDFFETRELVKQQLLLLLPERVLCTEECMGICPNCGANLNESQCACPRTADPRWAGLGKLQE